MHSYMKTRIQNRRILEIPLPDDLIRSVYYRACFAGSFYTLILSVQYYFIQPHSYLYINWLIASMSYFIIYRQIKKSEKLNRRGKLIFFAISFGVILSDFFQNGGIYSPILYLLVPISIFLLILTDSIYRLRLGISLLTLISILFYVHFKFPHIIIPIDIKILQFERTISLIISLLFSTYLIYTILNQHTLEKDKAIKSEQDKNDFLEIMSHMIRTPLNSINGYANFLTEDCFTSVEKSIFQKTVLKNAQNLASLINDLVKLSIIQNNSLKLRYSIFPIKKLIEELKYEAIEKIDESGRDILFTTKLTTDIQDTMIYSDYDNLKQALINIINNAVRFTEKGEIELSVNISEVKGLIQFSISDTGIGMKENQVDQLFELINKQSDSFSIEEDKSPGLGLNISKGIIQLLKGKIQVTSRYKEGTKVDIYFPKSLII